MRLAQVSSFCARTSRFRSGGSLRSFSERVSTPIVMTPSMRSERKIGSKFFARSSAEVASASRGLVRQPEKGCLGCRVSCQSLWDRSMQFSVIGPRQRAAATRAQTLALLKGPHLRATGYALTPTHTRKVGSITTTFATDVLDHGATRVGGGNKGRWPISSAVAQSPEMIGSG